MSAKIIDGKALAQTTRADLKEQADNYEKIYGRKIGLAVVLAGEDPASQVYVKNKISGCEQVNIKSSAYYLPATVPEDELSELILALNEDDTIDGILVQLPLPKHIDENKMLELVSAEKDVDGFGCENAGNLMLGNDCLTACTPTGVIELIKSTGVSIEGANAVVIGRSNIVGKPAGLLLLQNNATVTICHSRTKNIKDIVKNADIVVAAVGIKEFVTGDMIKKGAVVIDVGMNRFEGKLYGDVNFAECSKKASFITPVPGGVGPMTITMLLSNTVKAGYSAKV